jgi:ATP-binding cassette subfamily B protein
MTGSGVYIGGVMTPSSISESPVRFLFGYVRKRPWHYAGLAGLIAGAAGCAVAVQWGMKLIVDAMATPDRAAANVWFPLGIFITLIVVESIMWRLGGWLGCRTVIASTLDMRVDLFRHLTGHPMRYFSQHLSGALGNRITTTATAAGDIFGTLTWAIAPPCIDFVGAIIVLTAIHPPMALALALFVALIGTVMAYFAAHGRRLHRTYGQESARVGGEIIDTVSNVWTVKAFSAREREAVRLATELGVEANAHRRSWLYLEKARVLHDACLWVMAGTMLTWGLRLWHSGAISPGDVVVISTLTFRILHGSRDLALAWVAASQHLGVIGEMLRVIGQPHSMRDPEVARELRATGAIEFRDVSYAYADGRPIFRHLDLAIPAGQKVGIAGPSGAGKSTLTGLLQRMDDVQHGLIMIDGVPINELPQDALRAAIAVVPQDVSLFRRSVMENIRYGRPDATDEQVHAAARHAHCDEFIAQLGDGYDTLVGERGANISGGQRQRIGIARAFLKDAPILILDEATSALDIGSELQVQWALEELMQGRTVLAVTHRLTSLANFDRIVVLKDGRVVEDGSPDQLRRAGGLFGALWNMQGQAAPKRSQPALQP